MDRNLQSDRSVCGASRTRRARHALLLVPVLSLGAIGAASCTTTETPAAPPPPPTAPATAPPTTRDEKGDQQIAREALLEVDDLPGEWSETKRTLSSETEQATDNPIETCPEAKALGEELGLDDAPKAMSAKSSEFKDKAGLAQLNETVMVMATVDDATSMANVFGDDAMVDCVTSSMEQALSGDTTKDVTVDPSKIEVERSKVGKLGDDHAVFLITIPMQSKGVSITVSAVAGFVRVGRGYVNLSYVAPLGIDLDEDLLPVLETAAAKLRKAQQN